MNEEIKEIVRLNCEEEIDVKYFAKDDSLVYTTMDYSQLLDYVTNLQEENERLKEENILLKASEPMSKLEEMEKYEDIKTFLDRQSNCADDYDDISSYYLICRIRQMYNELNQIKLSYKKVIKKDFKKNLINGIQLSRQILYNYHHKTYKKEDILQGMKFAIDELSKLLDLGGDEE